MPAPESPLTHHFPKVCEVLQSGGMGLGVEKEANWGGEKL